MPALLLAPLPLPTGEHASQPGTPPVARTHAAPVSGWGPLPPLLWATPAAAAVVVVVVVVVVGVVVRGGFSAAVLVTAAAAKRRRPRARKTAGRAAAEAARARGAARWVVAIGVRAQVLPCCFQVGRDWKPEWEAREAGEQKKSTRVGRKEPGRVARADAPTMGTVEGGLQVGTGECPVTGARGATTLRFETRFNRGVVGGA